MAPVVAVPHAGAMRVALAALLALGWYAGVGALAVLVEPTLGAAAVALGASVGVVALVLARLGILAAVPVGFAGVVATDWHLIPPVHTDLLPTLPNALALASYVVAGVLLGTAASRVVVRAQASEASRRALAEEQAALRRIATLVAKQTPTQELCAAVAEETRVLLAVQMVSVVRYDSDTAATVEACAGPDGLRIPPGTVVTLEGDSVAGHVRGTLAPARLDDIAGAQGSIAERLRDLGIRSTVGCPVTVNGRLWGSVIAASAHGPLAEDVERRITEITELVATAISNAQNQDELRASRARVVAAGDETRRRLERDLHDGVQQRLVSLALGLRRARLELAPPVGSDTDPLAPVQAEVSGVIEDLRELSHGVHPAILSAGGLGAALRTLARRCAVPVDVRVTGDLALPEPVEVGAYYVVSEALTNVVKHAEASQVQVDVDRDGDLLSVRVADDGAGGAAVDAGTGLVGLTDRVAALGGELHLVSPRGGGTRLEVRLPVGPTEA